MQFEAMLTTARDSADSYDFALVAMLGRHRHRRHVEPRSGSNIVSLGESHAEPARIATATPNYILAAYMASGT